MADRFLSLPYLFLRSSTAGGALLFGLIQTFVFARVLSPERFSVFILIGTLGITLWLVDFGLTRILFVRQREAFLADRKDPVIAGQSMAVMLTYAAAVLVATIACAVIMGLWWKAPLLDATEFGLFFLFTSLNLVWFVVRFVSIATDQFIFFELHESTRRIGHIGLTLAMLIGLPFIAFLILANLLWAAVFVSTVRRMFARGVMSFPEDGVTKSVSTFFQANRQEAFRSASFSAGELYIYNLPYLIVPLAFGLGAPTIILDTVFKIFRGSTIIYAAGCDVAVPKQTRAYAAHDRHSLVRATMMAAALCSLPAIVLCALLYFAGAWFFSFLLGSAATMPAWLIPVLIGLLLANLVQTVSNSLLLHTGYFRYLAMIAGGMAVAMTVMSIATAAMKLDIVGYLTAYAAVFAVSVLFSLFVMVRGPIRDASS
jgi:O-antigen/teichoic acid export membrane protein